MANSTDSVVRERHPDLPPPVTETGIIGWLRANLFSSAWNTFLTLTIVFVGIKTIPPLVEWSILNATWSGSSHRDCAEGGACWALIGERWHQYLFGFYPAESYWRVVLTFMLMLLSVIPWLFDNVPNRKVWMRVSYAFPFVALWLLAGGYGLTEVPTGNWGGLMLTLVIAVTGIVASLPIGILLALGRSSDLPVIRSICVVFIEFIRGVPLITLLFMASVMLPLFFPEGVSFDKLARALIIVALFSSAYMAEVVRGGLQAVPQGQVEAARAVGLGYWQTMRLIVLPQALRIVIPGIVNTFIGLFKDTSLVMIIGLFDLLGVSKAVLKNEDWQGKAIESYIFVALIYWIFCFAMSRYSVWLEKKLDTGHAEN